MNHHLLLGRRALFAVFVFSAALLGLNAAENENAAADRILDRWVEATGGKKKLKAIKCSESRIRYTQNNFSWEMQVTTLPDGRYRGVMQTPAGEVIVGNDGKYGWTQHAALGGKVQPADEVVRDQRESGPLEPINARESYPRRRVLPDATIEGRQLRVVELTEPSGQTEKWYFEPATGLRVRREVNDAKRARTTTYSDFRKVDGIIQPFRGEMRTPSGTILSEYLTISHKATPPAEPWHPEPEFLANAERIEKILQRFRGLIGSEAGAAKIKTRVTRGHLDIKTNGVRMAVTISQKTGNRVLIEHEAPGLGKSLTGFDGHTGWAWSELQGYRELRGPELAQIIGVAEMHSTLHLGENTPFRRLVSESTDEAGHKIVAIDLATGQGSAGVHYFDEDTGLLGKVETRIVAGPGGSVTVSAEVSDYRLVGDERLAFVTKMTNPAFQMTTTIDTVEHNVELPDEIFLPRKKGVIPTPAAPAEGKPAELKKPAASAPPASAPAEVPAPAPEAVPAK